MGRENRSAWYVNAGGARAPVGASQPATCGSQGKRRYASGEEEQVSQGRLGVDLYGEVQTCLGQNHGNGAKSQQTGAPITQAPGDGGAGFLHGRRALIVANLRCGSWCDRIAGICRSEILLGWSACHGVRRRCFLGKGCPALSAGIVPQGVRRPASGAGCGLKQPPAATAVDGHGQVCKSAIPTRMGVAERVQVCSSASPLSLVSAGQRQRFAPMAVDQIPASARSRSSSQVTIRSMTSSQ